MICWCAPARGRSMDGDAGIRVPGPGQGGSGGGSVFVESLFAIAIGAGFPGGCRDIAAIARACGRVQLHDGVPLPGEQRHEAESESVGMELGVAGVAWQESFGKCDRRMSYLTNASRSPKCAILGEIGFGGAKNRLTAEALRARAAPFDSSPFGFAQGLSRRQARFAAAAVRGSHAADTGGPTHQRPDPGGKISLRCLASSE
jgi:hypothetical protein